MQLAIRHETLYRYTTPVRYSIQYLRLTPRSDAGQRVLDWRIDAPGRRWRQTDAFGNVVDVVSLDQSHDSLRIAASGRIETAHASGTPLPNDSALPPEAFLVATRLTTLDPAIRDIAARTLAHGTDPERGLYALMGAIRERVRYETGSTDVTHTAAEALAQGRGVCQDHAHILIACARAAGLPARYVSGYVDAGDASHVSSHAWADVWIAGRGWLGVDATHDLAVGAAYCRLAVGRDFLDASPVRGMRQGGAGESLDVHVSIAATVTEQ